MELTGYIAVAVCLIFTFINGFHDGCNVIATIVASRSISPKKALWIACFAEFLGTLLLGTSVAATIGTSIVNNVFIKPGSGLVPVLLFLSAVMAAILWNLFTWWKGMPSSSSHALIGGILGSGIAAYGFGSILWETFFYKVLLVLFSSPLIGFIIGYFFLRLVTAITKNRHPRTNNYLKKIQLFSMFLLGMSHGSNDAQKSMGIIAIILYMVGITDRYKIIWWIQPVCALMVALGLSAGGWRLIKTVGTKIFNVRPIHSFSSQMASAFTIITASITGGPVSTTQIVNSSVMGVGAAERKNAVRWDTVNNILISWVCTIPASAVSASVIYFLLRIFVH